MPPKLHTNALAVLLLAVSAVPAQAPVGPVQSPSALAFLPGTWAVRKDGFSFTVTWEPILGGLAYREIRRLDDNNRQVGHAVLSYDRAVGRWTKSWINRRGERAAYVGTASEDGLALEMESFGGRLLQPSRSRQLIFDVTADAFTLDWQTRADADTAWQPRAVPFRYRRVERPAAPLGAGRIAFVSNRSGDWEVYTMRPDGSDVRNLSNCVGMDHRPTWIAGGTRLAFASARRPDGRTPGDGGMRRFERDLDGTDLESVDLPGGLGREEAGMFPAVRPDGSYLVYAAERDGDLQLFTCRFDGGGEQPLAHAVGRDARPQWSPDGRSVLFESERDGDPELYLVEVSADGRGGAVRRLTDAPGLDRYAAFSPDGAWIAFASARDDGETLELYLMRRDGSGLRRLTDNGAEDGEPSWSPDGKLLVFRSNASGNPEICVLDVATGGITNVSKDPGYDGEPSWSPGG